MKKLTALFIIMLMSSFAAAQSIGIKTDDSPQGQVISGLEESALYIELNSTGPIQIMDLTIGIQSNLEHIGKDQQEKIAGLVYNFSNNKKYSQESFYEGNVLTDISKNQVYAQRFVLWDGQNAVMLNGTMKIKINIIIPRNTELYPENSTFRLVVNGIRYKKPNNENYIVGNLEVGTQDIHSQAIVGDVRELLHRSVALGIGSSLEAASFFAGPEVTPQTSVQYFGNFTLNNYSGDHYVEGKNLSLAGGVQNTFPAGYGDPFVNKNFQEIWLERKNGNNWGRITPVRGPEFGYAWSFTGSELGVNARSSQEYRIAARVTNWAANYGEKIQMRVSVTGNIHQGSTRSSSVENSFDHTNDLQTLLFEKNGKLQYSISAENNPSSKQIAAEEEIKLIDIDIFGSDAEDCDLQEISVETINWWNYATLSAWIGNTRLGVVNVTSNNVIIPINRKIDKNASQKIEIRGKGNLKTAIVAEDSSKKVSFLTITHIIQKGRVSGIVDKGKHKTTVYPYGSFGAIPYGTFVRLNRNKIGNVGFYMPAGINNSLQNYVSTDELEVLVPATEVSAGNARVDFRRGDVIYVYDPQAGSYGYTLVRENLSQGASLTELLTYFKVGASAYNQCYIVNMGQTQISTRGNMFEWARLKFTEKNPVFNNPQPADNQGLIQVEVENVGVVNIDFTPSFYKESAVVSVFKRVTNFLLYINSTTQPLAEAVSEDSLVVFNYIRTLKPKEKITLYVGGNTSNIGKAAVNADFKLVIGKTAGPFGLGGFSTQYVAGTAIVENNNANDYKVNGVSLFYGNGSGDDLKFDQVKIRAFPNPVEISQLINQNSLTVDFYCDVEMDFQSVTLDWVTVNGETRKFFADDKINVVFTPDDINTKNPKWGRYMISKTLPLGKEWVGAKLNSGMWILRFEHETGMSLFKLVLVK